MKLLNMFICQHCANDVAEMLSQCLESMRVWMEIHRLQLSLSDTEYLYVWGHPDPEAVPTVTLDGVSLSQRKLRHNLGALLGSQVLPNE